MTSTLAGAPTPPPVPNSPRARVDTLAFRSIQSEVLRGYNRPKEDEDPSSSNLWDAAPKHGAYVFLRFDDSTQAQAVLSALTPMSAEEFEWDAEKTRVNVGFTYAGLELLLQAMLSRSQASAGFTLPTAKQVIDSAGSAFAELKRTMAGSAVDLGDVGDSDPANWIFSDGDEAAVFGRIHAVAMVFGGTRDAVASEVASIRRLAGESGAQSYAEICAELDGQREHFGYVDGISQPAIRGMHGPVAGHGTLDAKEGWRAIEPGELVLGYQDEEGPFAGSPLLRNGSFFVLRKLEQDVAGFHAYLDEQAAAVRESKEWVAARMMGRYFDGTPVQGGKPRDNDFRFAHDNNGFGCPFGAHTRRANPRDVAGRLADRAERHRIVRRTLSYTERVDDRCGRDPRESVSRGQRLLDGEPASIEDDLYRRGMLFGCFNASIGRQFEIVQGDWLNGGGSAPARLFSLRDPIAGANHAGSGDFVIPQRPVRVLQDVKRFTTTRGGAYFFIPSIDVFHVLAPPVRGGKRDLFRRVSGFLESVDDRLHLPKTGVLDFLGTPIGVNGNEGRALEGALKSLVGIRTRVREVVPEEQILFMMAPLRAEQRATLERQLAAPRALDETLSQICLDVAGHPSIHHARFAIVSKLREFTDDQRGGEPSYVDLPHSAYLFFGCWYDGPRDALIDGLMSHLGQLPFIHCHGCPQPGSVLARLRFKRFIEAHEQPVMFAYRAYRQSTHLIRRALRLRDRFVALLADLQRARGQADDQALIDAFFAQVEERSADAAKRSR